MHYIGIDLGGTSIKGAVVTEGGTILKEASCPTQRELGPEHVAREIAGLITALAEGYDPQAIGGRGRRLSRHCGGSQRYRPLLRQPPLGKF